MAIEASFKAIGDSLEDIFHRSPSFPEFGIGGIDRPEIVSPGPGTRVQVTVLTVHPVADAGNTAFWSKIAGSAGDQPPAIADKVTCFSGRNGGRIGS
jgi:hypothetical protein